jgi:hypothetical protein
MKSTDTLQSRGFLDQRIPYQELVGLIGSFPWKRFSEFGPPYAWVVVLILTVRRRSDRDTTAVTTP